MVPRLSRRLGYGPISSNQPIYQRRAIYVVEQMLLPSFFGTVSKHSLHSLPN
jgi:hypothetical protein